MGERAEELCDSEQKRIQLQEQVESLQCKVAQKQRQVDQLRGQAGRMRTELENRQRSEADHSNAIRIIKQLQEHAEEMKGVNPSEDLLKALKALCEFEVQEDGNFDGLSLPPLKINRQDSRDKQPKALKVKK